MKESNYKLLKENLIKDAIQIKHHEYLEFLNPFFYIISERNNIRDLVQSTINDYMDDYIGFAMDMGCRTTEVKEYLYLVKNEAYLRKWIADFEALEKQLATIVRGTKKHIEKRLKSNKAMMSDDNLFNKFSSKAYPYKLKR